VQRFLFFPLGFVLATGCLDAPFGKKGTANLSHQISRAVQETLPEATDKAGGETQAPGSTAGALALALGGEIVGELGASLSRAGLTWSQVDFVVGRARESMAAAAGTVAVDLSLQGSQTPTQQELLAAVSPAVLAGAMRSLDEDEVGLDAAAERAVITGTVMESSMESLGTRASDVEESSLLTLMHDLALTAVSTLPQAGLGDADMADGAKAIEQSFAATLIDAGVPTEEAPAFIAVVVSDSVKKITTLVSEELLPDVAGAATEGAVAGVNTSGVDLATQGGDAAARISSAVVVAIREVAMTNAVVLAVAQNVVQGAVKAAADGPSKGLDLASAIAQIAKETVVALSDGASDETLAVSGAAAIAEGAVRGIGKSTASEVTIVSAGLLEGAIQGAVSGLAAAGKSAGVIVDAAAGIISKTVAAIGSVSAASDGNKVTLVGSLMQTTIVQLGSIGVTTATAMGTAIATISKAATIAVTQVGFSVENLTPAASAVLSATVTGIGKAGFSSAADVQALTVEAVKGTVSGFTTITNAATTDAAHLATGIAAITASGIKALGSYASTLSQDTLTSISTKVVGTVIEAVASGGVAAASLATITKAIKADATAALSDGVGVESATAFDEAISAATSTATSIASGQVGSCATGFADTLDDASLLALLKETGSGICLRAASATCPKGRKLQDPTSGTAIDIQWGGGFADPLLCIASVYGMAPASLSPAEMPPVATNDGVAPSVSAGADFVTNAAFVRTAAVVDASPTKVQWEVVSGPGTVTFSAAQSEATAIAASADGAYVIRITAQDASGLQASDDFTLIWDTAGPTNAAWGLEIAKSAGSGHAGVLNEGDDLEVFLEWDAASDLVGIRDYTVIYYTDQDCGQHGGTATEVTGLTTRSLPLTLANGDVLSFSVRAYDALGQATSSGGMACSSSLTVDTTDPADITDLQVDTGGNVGTVSVTVDFDTTPAVVVDYSAVRIVRGAAGGAAASCATSTVVKTYTGGQFADDAFTDFTNVAGDSFQYRACVYDAAGNLVDAQFATATSKSHILFVGLSGSTGIQGDFGLAPPGSVGVARGDEVCQAEAAGSAIADVASETASNWRAVLSDSTTDAKWRTLILGAVKNPLLTETYANGRSTMWGVSLVGASALPSPHTPDDDAYSGTVFWSVWTGSDSEGMRTGFHCNDWTDNTGGAGSLGNPSVATTAWIGTGTTLACNDASGAGIYCINQPAAPNPIAVNASTITSSSITLTIDAPDDAVSLTRYDRITIRRRVGSSPDSNCVDGADTVLVSGFGSGFTGFPVVAAAQQVVDSSGVASGTAYMYRVCGYDIYGNLISSTTATAATP
jgi:hypothetical protein